MALAEIGGWTVLTAESGPAALELAATRRPDLVLLDVMMPGTDGPTTLGQMRERAELADIPVIFLTAKVQKHEVERYMELGALGVLQKPFDPLSLADDVRALVEAEGAST